MGVVRGFWGSISIVALSAACSGKSENVRRSGDDGGSSGTAAGGSAGVSAGGSNGASGSVGDGSGGTGIVGAAGAGASGGAAGVSGTGAGGVGPAGAAGAAAVAGIAGAGQGGIGGSMPDSSLVGTWVGYVENYQFQSGSDEVRLVITDGAPSGYVVFGNGSPPPPPNPDTGYPPSSGAAGAAGAGARGGFDVYEGFRYTAFAGNVTGDRVRFKVRSNELWQEWCALQTPVAWENGIYGCMPNWGWASDGNRCWQQDPNTGAEKTVDCGKIALCTSFVCECTAQSCKASSQGDGVFDLDHKASELDGSINGVFGLHNVRLTQQQPEP